MRVKGLWREQDWRGGKVKGGGEINSGMVEAGQAR